MAQNFSTPGDPGANTRDAQTPAALGLISKEKLQLAPEELAPIGREQARKTLREEAISGPFSWHTAQYDQNAGNSGENDGVEGPIKNWSAKPAQGIVKRGVSKAGKQV